MYLSDYLAKSMVIFNKKNVLLMSLTENFWCQVLIANYFFLLFFSFAKIMESAKFESKGLKKVQKIANIFTNCFRPTPSSSYLLVEMGIPLHLFQYTGGEN